MSISIAHKDQGSVTDCALTNIIASRNTALNVASVTGILVTLIEIDNLQVRNLTLLVVSKEYTPVGIYCHCAAPPKSYLAT